MAKPKKPTIKSTKAELDTRVTEVHSLILQGYTRTYILQYGSKWAISDRQIDDYISMATVIIKESNLASVQDNMAIITHGLWDAYRQAKTASNIPEQHKILMSIAKLKGLEQHTVNHVIEDKRDLAGMSDADLDSMMDNASRLDS